MKLRYVLSLFVLGAVASFSLFNYTDVRAQLGAGSGTINQLTQWLVSGGYVKTASSTAKLWVPGLASTNDCLVTDGTGKVYTAPCGTGGSYPDYLSQVGDVSTTSLDTYDLLWYDGVNWSPVGTTSLGITGTSDGTWSTTSATYWETTQTARTADDLSDNTTTNLAEGTRLYYTDTRVGTYISGSTTVPHVGGTAVGDILKWTGSAWTTMATSGIGYLWDNLGNIPAGFADGVDDTGGTLSGGSQNTLTYWTSGSTVGATSSPTVGYVTATSTTATSTFPLFSVSGAMSLLGTFADQLSDLCVAITGGAGLCDGTDNEGTGGSSEHTDAGAYVYPNEGDYHSAPYYVATSTTVASTFPYASTTGVSATTLWGSLIGNVTGNVSGTAGSLATNGGNCSAGQFPLGVDSSGAVETCTDAWTEAENTSASYISASALTPYLTLSSFYSTTTSDIGEGTNLYYTDARVNSYIHSSTTIPKTYTANTFTGLQTIGNASTTHLSVSGNSYLGTVRTGTWNGTAIGDTYLTKSGDWTGSIDGNNFAGGAIGAGQLIYGSSAGSFSELTLGASSTILTNDGTSPRWLAGTALCVAITGSAGLCDGTDDGGSASPGGSDTYAQYNNSGSFGAMQSSVSGLRWIAGDNSVLVGTTSESAARLEVTNKDSTFSSDQVRITSTSASGGNADIHISSPDADIEFCNETMGANPSDCFEIDSPAGNNQLYFTPRNSTDSSYEFPALTIHRNGATGYGTIGIGTQYDTPEGTMEIVGLTAETNILALTSAHGATGGNVLTVLKTGNIGIGTTTPYAKLSVAGHVVGEYFTSTTTTSTSTMPRLAATTAFTLIGDYITNVATWFDTKIEALTAVVLQGTWDFGGATSLEIVNGTGPTVDTLGEIALDTTDDQLLVADSGGTVRVFATDEFRLISTTIASTSLAFASGQTLAALGEKDGIEITQYRCYVVGGTSKVVNLTDGTNDTETITCATTMTSDTDVATNDTFTADELGYLEMGATTGSVNYLHFEAWGRVTRE